MSVPDFLAPGWDRRVVVGWHEGGEIALIHYPETDHHGWAFEHMCVRGAARVRLRVAPFISKHEVLLQELSVLDPARHCKVTVFGSILCGQCKLHGFVTESVWREA